MIRAIWFISSIEQLGFNFGWCDRTSQSPKLVVVLLCGTKYGLAIARWQ
ncbi:hypothetical protein NDI39_07525 [Microcoleus sp. ZQ-A2]|nr:hypothetical protein [Microcoleus sp. FACHB-1]